VKPKKKREKKYKPRTAGENKQFGGLVAIAKAYVRGEDGAPLREDQTTDLGVARWLAFENLRSGTASEESWECVALALNVAVVMAEMGIGAEHEEDIVLALNGIFRAKQRFDKGGSYRLDGDALRDVEHALLVHDSQMDLAKRGEVCDAMETIRKRVAEGKVYGTVSA
jgi:hypothetical protein